MKTTILLAVAAVATAHAEKPIPTYLPNQPSGEQNVTLHAGGTDHFAIIRNFGVQDVQIARTEGRELAHHSYPPSQMEKIIMNEGMRRYHDPFFAKCFLNEATIGYADEKKLTAAIAP